MALALQPTLLLLDEPTAGMSPQETVPHRRMIQRLNAQGMTVLVVEHDMTFVRQIAQRITVLHLRPRVRPGQHRRDHRAIHGSQEIYLGKAHGRLSRCSTVAGLRAGYGQTPILQGIDLAIRQAARSSA